jgi:hypothetical protein
MQQRCKKKDSGRKNKHPLRDSGPLISGYENDGKKDKGRD